MTSHGEMFVTPNAYFGLAHVAPGVTNVALVYPAREFRKQHARHGSPLAILDAFVRNTPAHAARFLHAERIAPVRVTGPFDLAPVAGAEGALARRGQVGPEVPGALLVGDAADFFDPFTGEGIFAALRGGELAAPYIIESMHHMHHGSSKRAWQTLLEYHRQRKVVFGGKWQVERLIGLSIAFPSLLNRAARVLERDSELADLLVGVTGDFVPPSTVLHPRMLLRLLGNRGSRSPVAAQ